jgi:hypothetical protein
LDRTPLPSPDPGYHPLVAAVRRRAKEPSEPHHRVVNPTRVAPATTCCRITPDAVTTRRLLLPGESRSTGQGGRHWRRMDGGSAALRRRATPSVSEVHCATASTDCCFVEAVASRTPAALGGGAALWLNDRDALRVVAASGLPGVSSGVARASRCMRLA